MRIGMRIFMSALLLVAARATAGCSGGGEGGTGAGGAGGTGGAGGMGGAGGAGGMGGTGGTGGAGGMGGAGGGDPGPSVDTTNPQLYKVSFKADQADAAATQALGTQLAHLDTRVTSRGQLVVYLHGAGAPSTCGSNAHGEVLAGLGFHVFGPCYLSDYGVGNCGDDIEGCRLEAFDGTDHHPFVDITPPDSLETRIVKGLAYLAEQNPQGDWTYFVDGDKPRWDKIVISGISHGASTSAVIGKHRLVHRVVSLSGPLDSNQAWLKAPSLTPIDRFYALTHTADSQHPGHLTSFEDLGLPGMPTSVDGAMPPYGDSHRLRSSAETSDGHVSTQAGGPSPKDADGNYVFLPVWIYLYTGSL
ncbi:BPSS1187 family protein [Polyangium jinanense]|uniref:Alpha/beta hydrolase n=1 Tax=Polyangium jinanense TaxID=2829994 RepID=A0A9X4AZ72_9BACT|nr:hypothetical protein [Polyangium jinanense]MDC3961446.1 hypothetical protein [Polyangium jinanense]MDC3987877.1 hypothetical protein [Polyangium jinanense]